MRPIYAICALCENWKPSSVQLPPQICSGAFLVFLKIDYVAPQATGFVWLAWPEARNELSPLPDQTPGMAPTFSSLRALQLWVQLCCPHAQQLGPAALCPLPHTKCACLGVVTMGNSRLIFDLTPKAWDDSLCKGRRCWRSLLVSPCACFWLLCAS